MKQPFKAIDLFKPYLKKRKWVLFLIFLVVSFEAISGRSIPLLFGYAIDNTIKNPNLELLTYVALGYLLLSIAKTALRFLSAYLSERTANEVTYSLQKRIIRYIQKLPLPYFEKNHSGSLLTKLIVDTNRVSMIFSEAVQTLLVSIIEILTISVTLIYLSPELTFFTFIFTPPVYYFMTKINRHVSKKFLETKRILSKLNFFTLESLNGIKIFDSFNYLKKRKFQFFKISGSLFKEQLHLVKGFAVMWPLFNFFNAATMSLSLVLSYFFLDSWNLSIGEISAYILLLESFFYPLEKILDKYLHLQDSFSSVVRLESILSEPTEVYKGEKSLKHLKGKIEFRNVYFKYPNSKDWVLKDINMTLEAGTKTALIGKTGSGKTTLVELLQKFYEPQEGSIEIDGIPIKEIPIEQLRTHVGYIQQDVFLFKGSLLDNLTLYNAEKRELLKEKNTQIQKLLSKIQSMDYLVEENGDNLSAGQKQVAEVLRFLVYNPGIVVLDESLSYLDHKTAQEIKEIIYSVSQNKTLLEISHKIQDFKKFDQIVVLDKGEIIEKGSHSHLMELEKNYFSIVRQFSRFIDTY